LYVCLYHYIDNRIIVPRLQSHCFPSHVTTENHWRQISIIERHMHTTRLTLKIEIYTLMSPAAYIIY